MLNLKITLCFPALLLMLQVAQAQNIDKPADYVTAKMEEANKAENKKVYLQSYLNQWKANPAKYRNAPQKSCDSVAMVMQLDYQALLLSIFSKKRDKTSQKIVAETGNSFANSLQMVNERDWLPYRQDKLDKQIAKVNELLAKVDTF